MKPFFNSNKSSNQIKSYSAFATALLMSNQLVHAGVVYTDIDPDSVWTASCWGQCIVTNSFSIDINNDNINDVEINGLYSYSSYVGLTEFKLKFTNPNNQVNSKNDLVSKLNVNSVISSNLSWNKTYGQSFYLLKQEAIYGSAIWLKKGEWAQANKNYIAIKFENNGNYYFGWIRLSVTQGSNNKKIRILDYAYNDTPNTPIIAGDTSSITTRIKEEKENILNVSAYSSNNKVCVNFQQDFTNGNILIVNLLGQEIYKAKLTEKHTQIPINANTGEYFVRIQTKEGCFNKKVFLSK